MNPVCEKLNIKYPIIQGGMGNVSNAELASAISNAGGLGTIGVGTMTPDEVEKLIIATKGMTDRPFAVNVPLTVASDVKDILKLLIKHEVKVVSLSAGNPAPYIPKLKEHGITVITVIASVYHAKKAETAGSDLLVAEGYEAAGLNSSYETTTMVLLPQVSRSVSIPVIAAGGIADGSGLAAAFALGAQGVQMGTRFIATKEAPFHEFYKSALLDADDTKTMIVGRSVGKIRRIYDTPYAQKLIQLEKSGVTPEEFLKHTTEDRHILGAVKGDLENGFINSGQVAGTITDIPTVKELLKTMMKDAKETVSLLNKRLI
ncbi:NAD(P)H-dependent flavin oxidoreductase [Fictibacillus phosphorivorans]|uniref:NAD(P)H-dependent flavin oxidoreductase n=1 Tax=Fictibacillus phosphorivorans TaxID=1221500 RepID=UPI00203FF61F|nr:nitronate monooxygenase [Fictibacillus phosphorivorans]MCM3717450.1 nitronate monooxygenase [Fictibacillus phosphorivorans]MCM3775145.1 nitronate monooxygenase [Fictibacillus phosphorivorans]